MMWMKQSVLCSAAVRGRMWKRVTLGREFHPKQHVHRMVPSEYHDLVVYIFINHVCVFHSEKIHGAHIVLGSNLEPSSFTISHNFLAEIQKHKRAEWCLFDGMLRSYNSVLY